MQYRKLGSAAVKVSPICLGTMNFGDRTDFGAAEQIVKSAFEAGVNFIDTADVYVKGESERIVGKLISPQREHWVLATKVANAMGKGPNESGFSRKYIMHAVDGSLTRLDTDYIDIYYLHFDDPDANLAEALEAMADLVACGKIHYVGLSNFRGWRIAVAMELCRSEGFALPIVCQPYYNAMNRMPEVEILPACAYYDLGVVPYSPLARGMLTGKYRSGAAPPADSRAGLKDKRMMETEFREESMVMAQTIVDHAGKRGMTGGQFAINWVLNNRLVTSALAGPRTLAHWTEYLDALAHQFSAEDEALVDSLVPPGHPSTPGYNDPRYPFVGRLPGTAPPA
jgi:aryl-alcohol dehydrogenase-like predicted oxidoreductase